MAPGASLNLFSSREQEFEQRALLLKRLNFTIFCSDVDQYHKFMPDIQGGYFSINWNDYPKLIDDVIFDRSFTSHATCLYSPNIQTDSPPWVD